MRIYASILNDELNLKKVKDKNVSSLLEKLLKKDPAKRLQKPMEIRECNFMSNSEFEWSLFLSDKLPPVYYPHDLTFNFAHVNNDLFFEAAKI